jgi:choline dehydrogenase-like flavoprotein
MITHGIAGLETSQHDICVVGSGPVGLAVAIDLVRRGRRVLLLESGGDRPDPAAQSLSDAFIADQARHDDMSVAVARRLGGTSNLWGARCLPYDPIDFEKRGWVDACWPIPYEAVEPWLGAAVAATRSGAPVYCEPLADLAQIPGFAADHLERWANTQSAKDVHRQVIDRDPGLDTRLFATATGLDFDENGRVLALQVAETRTGERARVPIRQVILAMGGLETARLLLACQRTSPARFGGPDGPLGRYYMGHLYGEIADIQFARRGLDRAFGFHVDDHGSYVRRRLTPTDQTQREHRLLNSAFWPTVPAIADARHGSAILSMLYLAMSHGPVGRLFVAEAIRRMHVPNPQPPAGPHVANLVSGLPATAAFAGDFIRRRYLSKTRLPGFFLHNRAQRYGLFYHAEQAPHAESRVTLSGEVDRLGLPKLSIDLRFTAQDVDSVLRTHALLGEWLASTGLARLEYRYGEDELEAAVLGQARHGTHQVGLTRMATSPAEGVVDTDQRCFGAPNLYLATTAVHPTSSQANPTLTAVALGLRLSAHLAESETSSVVRQPTPPTSHVSSSL